MLYLINANECEHSKLGEGVTHRAAAISADHHPVEMVGRNVPEDR